MDSSTFERVARAVGGSRRSVVRTGAAGLAASALGLLGSSGRNLVTAAQDAPVAATPGTTAEDAAFLFVQTASSGSFTANPNAGATPAAAGTPGATGTPAGGPGGNAQYLLTLSGHPGETVYFSDRPERIFGEAPTETFLARLGFGASNPPNAAISTETADGPDDVLVVELVAPEYDQASGTLTYGVNIQSDYAGEGLAHLARQQTDDQLAQTLGRTSLFIDDCPDTLVYCATPAQVLACAAGGVVQNVGACWEWASLSCVMCQPDYPYCADNYPSWCSNNGCIQLSVSDWSTDCGPSEG
jgi:hypothetical protein